MDLLDAADVGNLDCVRMLVEQGADKDEGDSNGYTPLYIATRYGHLQRCSIWWSKVFDEDGETPLSEAAYIGQLEVNWSRERTGIRPVTAAGLPFIGLLNKDIRRSRCCS